MNPRILPHGRLMALTLFTLAFVTMLASGSRAQGASGTITSIAGTEGCSNLTSDPAGNLFFEDDHGVQKLDPASGKITTVAGRDLVISGGGLAIDGAGDLFIAQGMYGPLANTVQKIAAGTRQATLYAGTGEPNKGLGNRMPGPATKAITDNPNRLALDAEGNLYISRTATGAVWKVTAATGIISGVPVNYSPAKGAPYIQPPGDIKGMTIDSAGNLYLADVFRPSVWKIPLATLKAERIAGTGADGFSGDGGPADKAQFSAPNGLAVDSGGNLYIADTGNDRIRKVAPDGTITTVAGNGTERNVYAHVTLADGNSVDRYQKAPDGDGGPAIHARVSSPDSVALDHAGNLYICQGILREVRQPPQ